MEDREYTPYQKGVIKRYYQNIDAIKLARLEEILPEIYLAGGGARADRLWAKAVALLRQLGCPKLRADYIETSRDIEDLSDVLKNMR